MPGSERREGPTDTGAVAEVGALPARVDGAEAVAGKVEAPEREVEREPGGQSALWRGSAQQAVAAKQGNGAGAGRRDARRPVEEAAVVLRVDEHGPVGRAADDDVEGLAEAIRSRAKGGEGAQGGRGRSQHRRPRSWPTLDRASEVGSTRRTQQDKCRARSASQARKREGSGTGQLGRLEPARGRPSQAPASASSAGLGLAGQRREGATHREHRPAVVGRVGEAVVRRPLAQASSFCRRPGEGEGGVGSRRRARGRGGGQRRRGGRGEVAEGGERQEGERQDARPRDRSEHGWLARGSRARGRRALEEGEVRVLVRTGSRAEKALAGGVLRRGWELRSDEQRLVTRRCAQTPSGFDRAAREGSGAGRGGAGGRVARAGPGERRLREGEGVGRAGDRLGRASWTFARAAPGAARVRASSSLCPRHLAATAAPASSPSFERNVPHPSLAAAQAPKIA